MAAQPLRYDQMCAYVNLVQILYSDTNATTFKWILDGLMNMVTSQSEDNRQTIIRFVTTEIKKKLSAEMFSSDVACE